MRGRGYRNEFCQSLNDAEKERVEDSHEYFLFPLQKRISHRYAADACVSQLAVYGVNYLPNALHYLTIASTIQENATRTFRLQYKF